jgi:hypothetical protein
MRPENGELFVMLWFQFASFPSDGSVRSAVNRRPPSSLDTEAGRAQLYAFHSTYVTTAPLLSPPLLSLSSQSLDLETLAAASTDIPKGVNF